MGSWRTARLAGAGMAGLALVAAGLAGPAGPARAGAGIPRQLGSVRGGTVATIAGGAGGGPGPATSVAISPCGVRWAGGWLYIADGSTVRRVSAATGALTTVAGDNAAGPADASGTAVGSVVSQACSAVPDRAGNLEIAAGSRVLVVAARTGRFYGRPMTVGHLYTVAGSAARSRDGGPAGDGGPATRAALSDAVDVASDEAGNLLIADSAYPTNCEEELPLGSLVRVVAARTGTFYGQKMTAGHIYRVAGDGRTGSAGDGGPANGASLELAGSAVVDGAGNLVIGDGSWVRVAAARTGVFYGRPMTAGHIYGIAGTGQAGFSGDGGRASRSRVASGAVALDAAGNVLLAGGDRVRVVAARSGRFYGRPLTATPSSASGSVPPPWHSTAPATSWWPTSATTGCG